MSAPAPSQEDRAHSTAASSETNRGRGPTAPKDRILSLDVLRGFALLGILVINIWVFALPSVVLTNPTLYGDFSGLNYAAWFVSHVFFEQKFITLFTLLFGAGVVLFMESKQQNGQPARRLHFRRGFWLLVIGMAHAYLLWHGDILVAYALCGFVVVFLYSWRPRRLFIVGLVMFSIPSLLYLLGGVGYLLADAATQAEIETNVLAGFGVEQGGLDAEIAAYQGSWLEQIEYRLPIVIGLQTVGFLLETFWFSAGLMLIGMALYKWGVLSNQRSTAFYRRLFVGAGAVGLTLVLSGVWYREVVGWETTQLLLLARQFNYWGAPLLALAYVAGIMLLCRAAADGYIATGLSAVGKTAFSNYLLQTVVATTLFYGHGLGLFGTLERIELLAVVVLIWAVQIPLSVAWVNRYRFGPIEWLWRTLTYGERQPLRLDS